MATVGVTAHSTIKQKASFILFETITNYTTIGLYLYKMIYGLNFIFSITFQGRIDDEFILDKQGYEKWQTRVKTR